jgi:hypothetical protein
LLNSLCIATCNNEDATNASVTPTVDAGEDGAKEKARREKDEEDEKKKIEEKEREMHQKKD